MSWQSSPDLEFDAFSSPATTCWELLRQCASPEPAQAAEAIAAVYQRYRPVVLAYLRGRTPSLHDAQDLTQGFFVHALQRDLFRRADPAQGRFRAFLFICLQRFLRGEADRQRAAKRGCGLVTLPLAEFMKEDLEEDFVALDPAHVRRRLEEAYFDRHWAAALLDGVLDDLAAEFHRTQGVGTFRHFFPFMPGGSAGNTEEEHGQAATILGLSLPAFRGALHRLRGRYKVLLRAAVALTVPGATGEIDAELRHLAAALSARE